MCALFTGNNVIKLKQVDSTNKYLAEMLELSTPANGTVVIAENQTSGKGQRGAIWQSEAQKNFTFSIIYYPSHLNISKQFQLTQAISLGVYDYLCSKCSKVNIKWPNDLFVSGKKIGGLLIENAIKGESIAQVIVGIGLNINQQQFDLPENTFTSLGLENKVEYVLNDELPNLLSSIERRYLQLMNSQFQELKKQYIDTLYLYQQQHIYKQPNGASFEGKIIGINDKGQLMIQDGMKNIHQFSNKEIIF